MSELTNWLDNVVYPNLSHEVVFGDLEKFDRKNNEYWACCPVHPDKTPSFQMQDENVFGYCYGCGETISWYRAIKLRVGKSNVIDELARLAGVQPLSSSYTKKPQTDWWAKAKSEAKQKSTIIDYLKGRGYTDEQIIKMDIGTFSTAEKPKNISLPPTTHPLLLPIYERGLLRGCVGRAIDNTEPKYMYPKGLSISQYLLGARRWDYKRPIVVVEGLMDAVVLNSHGIQAGAIGKAIISPTQLEEINKFKQVVLALDNDDAGIKGTLKAIPLIKPRTYILEMAPGKDPDDTITSHGLPMFKGRISMAKSKHLWYIQTLLKGFKDQPDTEKDKKIDHLITYIELLSSEIEKERCLNEMSHKIGVSKETLSSEIQKIKDAKQAKIREDGIKNCLQQMQEAVNNKEIHKVDDIIADVKTLTKQRVTPTPIDYDKLIQQNLNRPSGISYPWRELSKLGEILPGTITTIIGGTSHGKTSVANALVLSFLEQGKKVVYWSGEMPADYIVQRMTGYLAELGMSEMAREQGNYYNDEEVAPEVIYARDLMKKFAKNLHIPEAIDFVEVGELLSYCQQVDTDVLVVDYIQQLDPSGEGKKYRSRDEETENVIKNIYLWCMSRNKYVIMLGQLNREGHNVSPPEITQARHSATIEHYSTVVLGVWNATMAGVVEMDEVPDIPFKGWYWRSKEKEKNKAIRYALDTGNTMMELSILKNRHFGNQFKSIPLLYDGRTGCIKDFPEHISAKKAKVVQL